MGLKIEKLDISKIYQGTNQIRKAFLGEKLIYQLAELLKLYGDSIQATTTGKNLFDNNNLTNVFLNTSTGTTSSNSSWLTSNYIQVEPNEIYTFGWESSSNYFQVNTCYYDADKKFISGKSVDPIAYSKTFTIPENATYIRLSYSTNVSGNTVTRTNIMFVKGEYTSYSAMLPYEPYTGGQPSPNPDYPQEIQTIVGASLKLTNGTDELLIPIDLKGYVLAKVGDIADDLQVDVSRGDVTLIKNIREYIVTGSEKFTNNFGTNLFDLQNIFNQMPFVIGYGMSNYYQYNSVHSEINNSTSHGEFVLQYSSGRYNLFFKNTNYSDATSFNSHLSELYNAGNPLKIYYPLLNPQTIALDNIKTQIDAFGTYSSMELVVTYG